MFYETSCFPFVRSLERHWEDILEEYDRVSSHFTHSEEDVYAGEVELSAVKEAAKSLSGFLPYVEEDMYNGDWEVFPFMFFHEKVERNCKACPKTWELLKDIPGLSSASFSVMKPSTEILPHTGFTNSVVRFQLPLIIPKQQDRAALIVGDIIKRWDRGQCFSFDDTVWHSCHNRSDETRVVLIIDVERTAYDHINQGTPPGTFSYGGGLPVLTDQPL